MTSRLYLYELNAARSAGANQHRRLATIEMLSNQRDEFFVRFAVDGRSLHPCLPRTVAHLHQRRDARVGLHLDPECYCSHESAPAHISALLISSSEMAASTRIASSACC